MNVNYKQTPTEVIFSLVDEKNSGFVGIHDQFTLGKPFEEETGDDIRNTRAVLSPRSDADYEGEVTLAWTRVTINEYCSWVFAQPYPVIDWWKSQGHTAFDENDYLAFVGYFNEACGLMLSVDDFVDMEFAQTYDANNRPTKVEVSYGFSPDCLLFLPNRGKMTFNLLQPIQTLVTTTELPGLIAP